MKYNNSIKYLAVGFFLFFPLFLKAQDSTELWSISRSGGPDGLGQIIKMNMSGSEISKVYDFKSTYSGQSPSDNPCLAMNGKFYGVAYGGRNNAGVIYCYDPINKIYEKLFDFNPSNNGASFPIGTMVEFSNGKFYGMTLTGGTNNIGTIFSFDASTNSLVNEFTFDNYNGKYPGGSLIKASNGLLYGMANGGLNNYGVIFSFNPNNQTFNKLLDFDSINGKSPSKNLFQANDGKLYGTTSSGGVYNYGVIFNYDPANASFNKLFDFNRNNGSNPWANLMQATNGKLYGMTKQGGFNDAGTIFSYDISTNVHNKLVDLSWNTNTINQPSNGFIELINGKLYSTAIGGVSNVGAIFCYDINSNTCTNLLEFNYQNGANPNGLVRTNNGKLYGTTNIGGTLDNHGVFYSWDATTNLYEKQFNFNSNLGSIPNQRLLPASNGKLYGMTFSGGTNGCGIIYTIDPVTNVFTVVYNFSATSGGNTYCNLMQADDGKLYGMTTYYGGGINDLGVIFSFDPNTNIYSKLYNFDQSSSGRPYGSLVQASNGKLYGMTIGFSDFGILFSFNPATNGFEELHQFDIANGAIPYGSLYQAMDGKLYGMTMRGGTHGIDCNGVIFSFDPFSNVFRKLANIDDALGIECTHQAVQGPLGSFIQAENGKLYATTTGGGIDNNGILFNFDPITNQTTKLKEFVGNNGTQPYSVRPTDFDYKLTLSSTGKLIGKTIGGGEDNMGTLYSYDLSNDSFTTFVNFHQIAITNRQVSSLNSNDSIRGGTIEIPVKGISIDINNSYTCTGQKVKVSVNVGYQSVCNAGNVFTAQLSDSSGNFSQPYTIGVLSSRNSGIINCNIPTDITEGKRYRIRVVSSAPNFTSNEKQIFIKNGPIILTQPISRSVILGSNTTLNLVASDSGFKYQWRKASLNLQNSNRIFGVKTNSLSINGAAYSDSSSFYNCLISDSVGCLISSSNVSLKIVKTAPIITSQPIQPAPICVDGSSVSLSVIATGGGLSYQWYRGTVPLYDNDNISGASTSRITINHFGLNYNGIYKVVVSNILGIVVSDSIYLNLNSGVSINLQPQSYQLSCLNGSFSLSVGASGTGLQYQWKKGTSLLTDGITSTNSTVSGSTTSTLTIQNLNSTAASVYSCTVKNVCSTVSSGNAAVAVGIPSMPLSISGPLDLCNYMGTNEIITYTTRKTTNTTVYKWTLPIGVSFDSAYGLLQNDTIIRVKVRSSFSSGTISVQAGNDCGFSLSRSLSVSKRVVVQPVSLQQEFVPSVPPTIKVCGLTTAKYKIRKSNFATSYIWLLNNGSKATISHLNPLGVNDTAIQVNFLTGFTKDTITVKSINNCSISTARILALSALNSPPSISNISGNVSPCVGQSFTYTAISSTPTITQEVISVYRWTVPIGCSITSANFDSSFVNILFGLGYSGGVIGSKGQTGCGVMGIAKTISLKYLPPTPSDINSSNGSYSACAGDSNLFTVVAPAPTTLQNTTAVYRWTIPKSTVISSASPDSQSISLLFLPGYTGGIVSARSQTSCGVLGFIKSRTLTLSICPSNNKLYSKNEKSYDNIDSFSPLLSPNPTNRYFTLYLITNSNEKIEVSTYDMYSKLIQRDILKSNLHHQIGNNFQPGVYFIEVKQGIKRKVLKGIKF